MVIHQLSIPVLKALEAKVAKPGVDHGTTDIEAGFKLGVQAVLKELRDGFAVDRG